jgi:hypothetical protein
MEDTTTSSTANGSSVSALEHNIKTKKENAYYYAHAYKFEKKENDPEAKVISGPGIITGGDPVLLTTQKKNIEILKEPKKFTKYIFYDDDKFVVVKIDLPEEVKDLITDDCLESQFSERSLDLKVNIPNGEPYLFNVKKLCQKIIPEESKVKLVKGKIVINIRKKDEDEEWSKLSA